MSDLDSALKITYRKWFSPILVRVHKKEFLENPLVFQKPFRPDVVYRHEYFLLKCIELASLFHLRLEWRFYDTSSSCTKLCNIDHFRWKMKKNVVFRWESILGKTFFSTQIESWGFHHWNQCTKLHLAMCVTPLA